MDELKAATISSPGSVNEDLGPRLNRDGGNNPTGTPTTAPPVSAINTISTPPVPIITTTSTPTAPSLPATVITTSSVPSHTEKGSANPLINKENPNSQLYTDFYNTANDARSEFGGAIPESIPDINSYQNKKTMAQGMMDMALFSANASQLRYVMENKEHPFYWTGVILIAFSLLLQVAIGVGLLLNTRYNVKDKKEICHANRINNLTIVGIFLVTVVNVFISAFGVASGSSPAPIALFPRFGNVTGLDISILSRFGNITNTTELDYDFG